MVQEQAIRDLDLTPWESHNEQNPNPLQVFSRTLVKMQRCSESWSKLGNKVLRSDQIRLPAIRLKTELSSLKCTVANPTPFITEMDEYKSSFYIREFRSNNSRTESNSKSPVRRKQKSSLKDIKCGRSVVICDLNKSTQLQIKEANPWVRLEQTQTKFAFKLKRMNGAKTKAKYKSNVRH